MATRPVRPQSRPWRSSPLAGPALSTLSPIISESSEDDFAHARSPSVDSSIGALGDGEASSSSVSLHATTTTTSSSYHQPPPRRLTKQARPRTSPGIPRVTLPPRARTVSHGHSRSASFSASPLVTSSSIPQVYSGVMPPTTPDADPNNTVKHSSSKSRDTTSNWMSSSPFGPAEVPKFSRLAMASPAVVMPLSAREYRKQKAKESMSKGKDKDKDTKETPATVPLVKVSPPPNPTPRQASPNRRSRPNTPPRSSPLASHPPISPKSSTGTFFSVASSTDDPPPPNPDDPPPPARPRPRPRRRKSYPDRLSNGAARLSLVDAMNRLSQEALGPDNRLSVVSQDTVYYDVEDANNNKDPSHAHTKSLEDLSSTLARTGIELARPDGEGKRNVRMVRISDRVEVSPVPVPRRRKLTKTRPVSTREIAAVVGAVGATTTNGDKVIEPVAKVPEAPKQTPTKSQARRTSLLPWRSKTTVPESGRVRVCLDDPVNATGDPPPSPRKTRRATFSFLPTPVFSRPKKSHSAPVSVDLGKDQLHVKDISTVRSSKSVQSTKSTKSLQSSKSGKSASVQSIKSRDADSTSTSLRTITEGSQSTLVPVYDLTPGVSSRRFHPNYEMDVSASTSTSVSTSSQSDWHGSMPSLVTSGSASSATLSSGPRTPFRDGFVARPSGLKVVLTDTSEEGEEREEREERPASPSPSPRPNPRSPGPTRYGSGEDVKRLSRSQSPSRGVSLGAVPNPSPDVNVNVNAKTNASPRASLSLPRAGSRPGSASSTMTSATGTETSVSYVSFSSVPASTLSVSSSRSASPRTSLDPPPAGGMVGACERCGHSPEPKSKSDLSRTPSPSPPSSEMHPMFTIPLLTIPASSVVVGKPMGPREQKRSGSGKAPRRNKHASASASMSTSASGLVGTRDQVPVPAVVRSTHVTSESASATTAVATVDLHAHARTHVDPPSTAVTIPTSASTAVPVPVSLSTPIPIPAPVTPAANVSSASPTRPSPLRSRRPQTAPAGTGAAASKFLEQNVTTEVEPLKPTAPARSGKSLKTVLKGLLRW